MSCRALIGQPEGLKSRLQARIQMSNTPPAGNDKQKWQTFVDRQWDEFIKDILALTNGNVNAANLDGLLVIGAGDALFPDGTRELFDASGLQLAAQQIQVKVNSACHPPVPDIHCEQISLDGKTLWVVSIPPSPYLHETNRDLRTVKGEFDEHGQLRHVRDEEIVHVRHSFYTTRRGHLPSNL